MAERRMFSKKITESDAFLDMPSSTQNLYFHFCMNADDDGFVGNPKSIIRIVGARDDDANILLAKKFILAFENGIIVIKHWRLQNIIRADRYIETTYKEQKQTLNIDENGSYTTGTSSLQKRERKPLTPAQQKRLDATKYSELPYSFTYKIRNAFVGELCPICGCKMGAVEMEENDPIVLQNPMPTIQHNLPISKGGKHELSNISIICQKCNYSLQDNETGELNNAEVVKKWAEINGNGAGMETQYSIGKDSIGNNNSGKHLYGEYKWIALTDSQMEKLIEEFGQARIDFIITKLDEYLQGNGNKNKYKDFNLVIRRAIRDKWFDRGDINSEVGKNDNPNGVIRKIEDIDIDKEEM